MRIGSRATCLLAISVLLAGCGKDEPAALVCGEVPEAADLGAPDASLEDESGGYVITITACELDPAHVFMVIETNLPLPVEVIAGVNLVTRAPGEIYIGHAEPVLLETAQTVHALDLSLVAPPLRGGAYEARVAFFSVSGTVAENPAAAQAPEIWAATPLVLTGSEPEPEPEPEQETEPEPDTE